jgi:hypothetical protein
VSVWEGAPLRRSILEMPKSRIFAKHGVVVAIDEEHVVGLEVAVDDPRLVGAGEAAQQLGRDVQRFGELEPAEALDAVAEVFAAQAAPSR